MSISVTYTVLYLRPTYSPLLYLRPAYLYDSWGQPPDLHYTWGQPPELHYTGDRPPDLYSTWGQPLTFTIPEASLRIFSISLSHNLYYTWGQPPVQPSEFSRNPPAQKHLNNGYVVVCSRIYTSTQLNISFRFSRENMYLIIVYVQCYLKLTIEI